MKAIPVKILTYNTCFGLRANTLIDAYNATWRVVHKRKDSEEINRKSDFSEVFDIINKEKPDLIILNEIFDNLQTEPLIRELRKAGYKNTFIGNSGHHTNHLIVSTVVASRFDCKKVDLNLTFPGGIPGTGGGAAGIFIKELDLFLVGLHIAYREDTLLMQLKEIDQLFIRIKDKYKNIIFAGDFNREYKFYRKKSKMFREFDFIKDKRTFPSFFPFYKPLKYLFKNLVIGQVDNIFYKGNIKTISSKVIDDKRSDHKPFLVTIEIKKV